MDKFYDKLYQLNSEVRLRFEKLERRIRKNEVISGFYEGIYQAICDDLDYYTGVPDVDFKLGQYTSHVHRSIDSVKSCSRWFDLDYYPLQGVKDLIRTYSCNNKFCDGCQSGIAQQRYEKFAPVLEVLQKSHDVAHVVITVPNCKPSELFDTLNRMYEARKYFIRYLSGRKRIRGIDFDKYGFQGGISALEISRNEDDGTFHPHFHCAFVFNKKSGVFAHPHHVNSYSFDKNNRGKENVRYFSDFEILLQKVWRLRFDGYKVNRINIDSLPEGYSVICERRKNLHEVFKYATKGVLKYDRDVGRVLGQYTDFIHLDRALFQRRLIQSYGILRGIPLMDTVDQSADGDHLYEEFITRLRSLEDPLRQRELLESLLDDQSSSQNIKYISRHNISAIIGDLEDE